MGYVLLASHAHPTLLWYSIQSMKNINNTRQVNIGVFNSLAVLQIALSL